jgi:hypothetical protein
MVNFSILVWQGDAPLLQPTYQMDKQCESFDEAVARMGESLKHQCLRDIIVGQRGTVQVTSVESFSVAKWQVNGETVTRII